MAESTVCEICGAQAGVDRLARHRIKAHLLLQQRRGTKVKDASRCASCGEFRPPLWRYRRTNLGEVRLCSECKTKAFDRSFGHIDALKKALQGGAFDSSRKRH